MRYRLMTNILKGNFILTSTSIIQQQNLKLKQQNDLLTLIKNQQEEMLQAEKEKNEALKKQLK